MDSKKLCPASEVPEGKAKKVLLDSGQEIALFKYEGEIYALNNLCPHKGAPLNEGYIEGGCVSCPWHGWEFDLKTGICENHPDRPAQVIPVKIEEGIVVLARVSDLGNGI